jgi:hypothetical protein
MATEARMQREGTYGIKALIVASILGALVGGTIVGGAVLLFGFLAKPNTQTAEQAARPTAPKVEMSSKVEKPNASAATDGRRLWRFAPQHGSGYFRLLDSGFWEEIGRDGKRQGLWQEIARTPEYVELYDQKRNYKTRLGEGQSWLAQGKDSNQFNLSPEGSWDTANAPRYAMQPNGNGVASKAATGNPARAPVQPERPAFKVEAGDLFAVYGKDVLAADKWYTGQIVELANLSGKVQKDRAGRYYLIAADQARFVKRQDQGARVMSIEEAQRRMQESALNTKYLPGIILYLDSKEAENFLGLGDRLVTVLGECKGMTEDPKTEPGYFVTVESVRLLAARPR